MSLQRTHKPEFLRRSISVNAELQQLYSSYDHGDPRWHRLAAEAKARNILAMTAHLEPRTMLDIGAGDGSVLNALIDLGWTAELYALEISEANVRRIQAADLSWLKEVHHFDGYMIPYPDKAFDLAIVSHVLEHVEHERLFLVEAARVARFVFIEVPLESTIRLSRNFRHTQTGHINFYSFNSLRRLVQTCGLSILDQRVFDIPLEILSFRNRAVGMVKFLIRRGALLTVPGLAAKALTYHCGLLCEEMKK